MHAETLTPRALEHIWIELTHRCNVRCSHCYTSSSPDIPDAGMLDEADYDILLSDARQLGARSVQFIGGEPMLSNMLPRLIRKSSDYGFERIEIYSNLVSLPSPAREAIVDTGACVATSMFGANEEDHDAVTRQRGSFRKTSANIERLVADGVSVRVGVVDVADDPAQADAAARYAVSLGGQHVSKDRARPFGRLAAEGQDEIASVRGLCGRCWSGKLCIDPSGLVSPCIMSKQWPIGSIATDSLLDLAEAGAIDFIRRQLSELHAANAEFGETGCDPEDNCGPGACKPQFDGPPDCSPASKCAPELWPGKDD